MIYDAFVLYNNPELLEIRLNILYDVVDKFIIIDSNKNIDNIKRDFLYNNCKNILTKELEEKIIYLPIEDIIFDFKEDYLNCQFAYLNNILDTLNDNDQIILSDMASIPNPDKIKKFEGNNKVNVFSQIVYEYYLNTPIVPNIKWNSSVMLSVKKLYDISPELIFQYIKNNSDDIFYIDNGGWCFTNFYYKKTRSVEVKNISESDFPEYIKQNIKKYQKYLCPIEDNYLNIEGFFNYKDLYNFVSEYFYSNSKIVEIGCLFGESCIYLATKFKLNNKNISIDAIDFWELPTKEVYQTFLNNIEQSYVADYINPIKMKSLDAVKLYEDNSLDFIFIDADHSYDAVKLDIEEWYKKLKPNGIMAGHDIQNKDVLNAFNDFVKEHKNEVDSILIWGVVCWVIKKKENKFNFNTITNYIHKNNIYDNKSIIKEDEILERFGVKININQPNYIDKIINDAKDIYCFLSSDKFYLYYKDINNINKITSFSINNNYIEYVKTIQPEIINNKNCEYFIFEDSVQNCTIIIELGELKVSVYKTFDHKEFILDKEISKKQDSKYKVISIIYDNKDKRYLVYLKNKEYIEIIKVQNFNTLLDYISNGPIEMFLEKSIDIEILKDKIPFDINIDNAEIIKYNDIYVSFLIISTGKFSDIHCFSSSDGIKFIPPSFNAIPYITNLQDKYPKSIKTILSSNQGIFHSVLFDNEIHLFKNRKNGIFSLDATDGYIILGPLGPTKNKMTINAQCYTVGEIKVLLLDKNKNTIKHYTMLNCDPIRNDNLNHIVTWKNNSNLDLNTNSIYIYLEIKNSKIYTIDI